MFLDYIPQRLRFHFDGSSTNRLIMKTLLIQPVHNIMRTYQTLVRYTTALLLQITFITLITTIWLMFVIISIPHLIVQTRIRLPQVMHRHTRILMESIKHCPIRIHLTNHRYPNRPRIKLTLLNKSQVIYLNHQFISRHKHHCAFRHQHHMKLK
jgi:hypothetical protein